MDEQPTFFKDRRISVYCKGGRLFKDKKTDVRYWRLKLALAIYEADARACQGAILSNFQHIEARQNEAGRIDMDSCASMVVTCFESGVSDAPQLIRLDKCFLDSFAMTWADGVTEFWLNLEHENTDDLHQFVKRSAFTRFFVEFRPMQRSLAEVIAQNRAPLDALAEKDGTSWELTDNQGRVLAKSKPKDQIH